jgi:hypothetical protein
MRDMNRRSWFSALAGVVAATLRAANPPSSSLGGLSEPTFEDLIASVREHEGAQASIVLGKIDAIEVRHAGAGCMARSGITVPADGKVRTFTLSPPK